MPADDAVSTDKVKAMAWVAGFSKANGDYATAEVQLLELIAWLAFGRFAGEKK